MARERSEKSKNNPVNKPESKPGDRKEKFKSGKSDGGGTRSAQPTDGAVLSGDPTQAARSRKHQERRNEGTPGDGRESDQRLEQAAVTTNGNQGVEKERTETDWVMHHQIAERAFILFQESGCEHGNDWSHWFEAERQLRRT